MSGGLLILATLLAIPCRVRAQEESVTDQTSAAVQNELHEFTIDGTRKWLARPVSVQRGVVEFRFQGGGGNYAPLSKLSPEDVAYLRPFLMSELRQSYSLAAWQHLVDADAKKSKVWRAMVEAFPAKDYDKLEELATTCREDTATSVGPWQTPLLSYFYNRLDYSSEITLEDLEAWAEARPRSKAAQLALASRCMRLGWEARGGKTIDQVTKEGYAELQRQARRAAKILEDAKDLPEEDPYYYDLAVSTNRALGNDGDELVRIAGELAEHAPTYMAAHVSLAYSLLPRWGGHPDATETYCKLAADNVGGRDGDKLYASLCMKLHGWIKREVFEFDLDRVERGARAILADEPDDFWAVGEIAQQAMQMHLFPLSRDAFDQLEARDLPWNDAYYGDFVYYERERRRAKLSVDMDAVYMLISIHPEGAREIRFLPNGRSIISVGPGPAPKDQVGRWSVLQGIDQTHRGRYHENSFEGFAFDLAGGSELNENSTFVAGRDGQGNARWYWSLDGRFMTSHEEGSHPIQAALLLPHEDRAIIAGGQAASWVRSFTWPQGNDWKLDPGVRVIDMALDEGAESFVVVGARGKIAVVDIATRKVTRSATLPTTHSLTKVAYAPDGETLLVATKNKVYLLDIATLETKAQIETPGNLSGLAVSPKGTCFATAHGKENLAVLWDWETRKEIRKLVGHSEEVTSVDFHPSGRLLGTGSLDGSIRLWDVELITTGESSLPPLGEYDGSY
ncbi:MAG: hypothetical protein KF708_09245 [Pirellulales bacterium]|nr:hypothetical protein [Pirellulales bacterium]